MLMVGFRSLVLVVLAASAAASAVACAAPVSEEPDEVMVDDAELRSLKPGELAGSIACGETKRVHHSGKPTYRALAIAAKKGQALDVRVSAPGHDARAWLTTASNATRAANDDAAAGTKDARILYTAKSTGTHHVVFREKNFEENVDFDVTLACPGATDGGTPPPATDDPFDPASCDGAQITQAQAIAKIGAGNAFKVVAPAKKLMARKRSCNAVTGCGAWSEPAPASHTFYMASGGDNYNVPRQYDVHFMLSVAGSSIEAVIEDVSNRGHCPGCSPSGITYALETSSIRDFYGDAALFIYYPRWNHTSSGFRVMDEWASVPLGPKATTTMKVTDKCARASVLSADRQTEYGVLFRY